MQPTLLIASPQMKDPFFERTVVLVWHHNPDGAIGVVVNRALAHSLGDVLDAASRPDGNQLDLEHHQHVPVVWGGPVESGSGTVVTGGQITDDEGWLLPNGLSVTQSQEALFRLLASGAPLMLCLGYAGWGPGQLDKEIAQGGWLWTDCDVRLVFETPAELRWDQALATLGLKPEMVWMTPIEE